MPDTQQDLDRVRRDIASCRTAMNNPKVGLFAMRKLYARYGQLLREQDTLELSTGLKDVELCPENE